MGRKESNQTSKISGYITQTTSPNCIISKPQQTHHSTQNHNTLPLYTLRRQRVNGVGPKRTIYWGETNKGEEYGETTTGETNRGETSWVKHIVTLTNNLFCIIDRKIYLRPHTTQSVLLLWIYVTFSRVTIK